MKFHRTIFLAEYRQHFGVLTDSKTLGLCFLLERIEHDVWLETTGWVAYMLATVKHECADTWHPISERGRPGYFAKYEPGTSIGKVLGNTEPGDGYRYRGRGYVQLTGRANYDRMMNELHLPQGESLVATPDLAKQPDIAYRVMSHGMRKGSFTGRRLTHYITAANRDWKNARRIINGLDRWKVISEYAESFYQILEASLAR